MSNSMASWQAYRPTKGVAFSIHMVLSLIIFSTLVAMMLVYWYPGDLFFMDGGWQGLKLVAMVDLVLGPVLTLILYKPGKPKLMLDMSLIALIQISALVYGFYTTHQQRAVAIVFAESGFNTLSARDNTDADELLRTLNEVPQDLPPVAAFNLPLLLTPAPKKEEYGLYLQDILNGYPGPQQRSDQYIAVNSNHKDMQTSALNEEQLADQGMLEIVQKSLNKRPLNSGDVEFYRFKARYANGVVIYDPQANRIVDMLSDKSGSGSVTSDESDTKLSENETES